MTDKNSTHESREELSPLNGGGATDHVAQGIYLALKTAAIEKGIDPKDLLHLMDERVAAKVVGMLAKATAHEARDIAVDGVTYEVRMASWNEMLTGFMAARRLADEGFAGNESAFHAWLKRRKPTSGTYVCVVGSPGTYAGDPKATQALMHYADHRSMERIAHVYGGMFTDNAVFVAFRAKNG